MKRITAEQAARAADKLKIRWDRELFGLKQLRAGMQVELEHMDVTKGSMVKTARIALAHLRECPTYYERLAPMEKACEKSSRRNPMPDFMRGLGALDLRILEALYEITPTVSHLGETLSTDDRWARAKWRMDQLKRNKRSWEMISELCAEHGPSAAVDLIRDIEYSYQHGAMRDYEYATDTKRKKNPRVTHRPDDSYPRIDPTQVGFRWAHRTMLPSEVSVGDIVMMKRHQNLPGYGNGSRKVVSGGPKNLTVESEYQPSPDQPLRVLTIKVPRHHVAYVHRGGKVYVVTESRKTSSRPTRPATRQQNPVKATSASEAFRRFAMEAARRIPRQNPGDDDDDAITSRIDMAARSAVASGIKIGDMRESEIMAVLTEVIGVDPGDASNRAEDLSSWS